jgi:hypothetical protein
VALTLIRTVAADKPVRYFQIARGSFKNVVWITTVLDQSEWKLVPLKCVSPCTIALTCESLLVLEHPRGLALTLAGPVRSPLDTAVRAGLPSLTVDQMLTLIDVCKLCVDVKGRNLRHEAEIFEAIARAVLPSELDEVLPEVIALRGKSKVKSEDDGSLLCKDPGASSYLEGMVEDAELAEIVSYAEKFRADTAPVDGARGAPPLRGTVMRRSRVASAARSRMSRCMPPPPVNSCLPRVAARS